MSNIQIEKIKKYVRAANYLTVTQIYLQDNFLLEKKLSANDIKPKLFGHWGTCPGINFVYGNINYLVKKHHQSTLFILGPGHGFPALQANIFLEGTLGKYYKKATLDELGISYLSKMFSWPYGFSSHSNPQAPGLILEGGELGYSLATAYGAILDNPDLLAVCMIGDGEAETGPLASAWHINKLIDPVSNGTVLPILHLNGYKISGPSIFGRMNDEELMHLFIGYGYEPFIVRGENIYQVMSETLEVCLSKIKKIKNQKKQHSPKFPMIILDTPKGWTGVKLLRDQQIEGTILSHQVVAPNARHDEEELQVIEQWLQSYKFEELYDKRNGFSQDIQDIIPDKALRIGDNKHVFGSRVYKDLVLPDEKILAKTVTIPGKLQSNSMRMAGKYLQEVFFLNKKNKNFRLLSPDETYSNRLDTVFTQTSRAFVWPKETSDKHMSTDGRVMEMLSEHNLHGLAQGYILTGRHAVFTTYEAFAQIFSSMAHQYAKFLRVSRQTSWRGKTASMNYMLSSVAWRQEHNGYSHQNPSFISGMLERQDCKVNVYFPADENSMLACLHEVMSSTDKINTIIAGKTPEPQWLSLQEAKKALANGLAIWDFASDPNPDIVVVGIGDYMTKEALAAIEMVKKNTPEINIRFVNVARLSARCSCIDVYHQQIPQADKYFTKDKPVIVNFHGYPEVMKSILFDLVHPERFQVHGYIEQGGTTTPFDMHIRNKTSRYHLAIEITEKMIKQKVISQKKAAVTIVKYQQLIADQIAYVIEYGTDPVVIETWQWRKDRTYSTSEEIQHANFFKNVKTIAVIGLSNKHNRHSHRVALYFKEKGFRIIPVNPHVSEVLGEKAYPDLLSVPKEITVDIVDIFRSPDTVVSHMKEILQRGDIKTIWLQKGVSSQEAEDFARDFGLTMVSNFCIMEAYKQAEKA